MAGSGVTVPSLEEEDTSDNGDNIPSQRQETHEEEVHQAALALMAMSNSKE